MRSAIFTRTANVVKRSIAGETLLVPIGGRMADLQQVFVIDTVGAQIWDRLDGRRTLEEIHRELLDLFEVSADQLESDISEFVTELREAGLVEQVSG